MHSCTSCAGNSVIGVEAANVCTSCGAVASNIAEASVSPLLIVGLAVAGVSILAYQVASFVRARVSARVAAA